MKFKFGQFKFAKGVFKAVFGKQTFDYDVDDLEAFVNDESQNVLTDFVNEGNIKSRINIMPNVKGSEPIKLISSTPSLQSAASCGWTAEGGMILTDEIITTVRVKIQEEYCNENLNGTWAQMMNAIGANVQDETPPTFAAALLVYYQQRAQELDENLIINGDTTSLDGNLVYYDGFKKRWDNDADLEVYTSTETSITDSNAFAIAQAFVAAIPTKVKRHKETIKLEVLVGYETAQKIINNIYATKDYNAFIPVTEADGSITFILPTTNITFRSIVQLDGTESMFGAPHGYMFYGTDLTDDISGFQWKYSEFDELLRFSVKWRTGIAYVFPETFTRLELTAS